MSSNKRKRDPGETNSPKDNKQILTKGKEKRGRNKKETSEEEKKKILEEVEREIESYKKTIGLNENDIIPYSSEEMTNFPNHFSKQLSQMIKVFIYNLNQDPNNEYTNEIDFAKKIKKIISILNMNENDFAFFTILLDKIGWLFGKNYDDIFKHLHYIGILAMQYSSGKFIYIKNDEFNMWKDENKIGDDKIRAIDIKETNKRKEELLSSYDEYDPDKYLDYNQMVDDIIMNARIYKENK